MSDEEKVGPIITVNRGITTIKHKRITGGPGKNRPAQFVLKLWSMVNDPKNQEYIRWMPDGKSFQVLDREEFMMKVLPQYFKHKNFSSFVRQLNMYGWHKVQDITSGAMQSTDEMWQFESPYFIRDREDLLENIVRNRGSKGSDDEEESLTGILRELQNIRRNQEEIGQDLNRIKKDNQMLWAESYQSRERHQRHAETLDRILRFLASLYGNQGKLLGDMISPGKMHQKLLMANPEKMESPDQYNGGPVTESQPFDSTNRIISVSGTTPGTTPGVATTRDPLSDVETVDSTDVNNLALTLADKSTGISYGPGILSPPALPPEDPRIPGSGPGPGDGDIPRSLFPELYDGAHADLQTLDDHDNKMLKNGLDVEDVSRRVESQEHSLQQMEDWIAKLAPDYDDATSSNASEHFNVDDFLADPSDIGTSEVPMAEPAQLSPTSPKITKKRRRGA